MRVTVWVLSYDYGWNSIRVFATEEEAIEAARELFDPQGRFESIFDVLWRGRADLVDHEITIDIPIPKQEAA